MIRMNDFTADPAELRAAQLAAVGRVLDSGWYVLGPEVAEFEKRFAAVCGVPHAIGVANGMDAIEIGLRALGIGPGDEVITTPMTAFATVLAIYRTGATPYLADIDPASALLCPDSARRCITPRTRAILLVHLYGQVARMDEWQALAREQRVYLVEDCAQSHLARWSGKVAGAIGACGAYSFYPTKNLGTAGDGGALVSNDAALAARARTLRNYGQSERYHHPVRGLNSRLDEVHAAMLSERLAWLERFTQRRRDLAQAYRAGLRNPAVQLLQVERAAENHVHHLFVVTCERRAALVVHLRERGVESLSHYPIPIHHQLSCAGILRDAVGLAAAERHAATCLSLPCHHNLDTAAVQQVIAAVNSFV